MRRHSLSVPNETGKIDLSERVAWVLRSLFNIVFCTVAAVFALADLCRRPFLKKAREV